MTFSPWIARNPVDGDDCPVPGQKVQAHYSLQTRDQAELSAVQSADDLPWNHSGNPIIAYRCVICETSRATPLVPPAVMVGDGEVDALLIRLTAPHYWMSGSDQGHEGENSAAYEAGGRTVCEECNGTGEGFSPEQAVTAICATPLGLAVLAHLDKQETTA